MRLPKVHYCQLKGRTGYCVYWSREGKQFHLSVPLEDEAAVKAFCQEEEKKIACEILGLTPKKAPGTMTLGDTVKLYLEKQMAHGKRAESTIYDREYRLHRIAKTLGEGLPIGAITEDIIEDFAQARRDEVGPTTLRNDLVAFGSVLRWAVRRGYLSAVPRYSVPRGKSHKTGTIPTEHVLKILAGLDLSDPHERAFYLALHTGMRGSDLATLQPGDWDAQGKCIRKVANKTAGKTGADIVFPLTSGVWARLEPYMGLPRFCRSPVTKKAKLFTKRICGVGYGIRLCRPTWATAMAEGGADFLIIKALMAHKMEDITAGYIKSNLPRLRAEVEKLPWSKGIYMQVITQQA